MEDYTPLVVKDFIFNINDQEIGQKYTYSVSTSYPVGYDEYGYAVSQCFKNDSISSENPTLHFDWNKIIEFDLNYVGDVHYWNEEDLPEPAPENNWQGSHKPEKNLTQHIKITSYQQDYILELAVYEVLDTSGVYQKDAAVEISDKNEIFKEILKFSNASITPLNNDKEVLYVFQDENNNEKFTLDILKL